MNWCFWKPKKKGGNCLTGEEKERHQMVRIRESQIALIDAATSTADLAQDVTLKLKDKLDDSIRQLESTTELINDALLICYSDGLIESTNQAAERMFGWAKPEMAGMNITHLFRMIGGAALDAETIWNVFNDPYFDRSDIEDPIEHMRGKKKNGEVFWVDGNITRLEKVDGSSIIMLLVRDVTNSVTTRNQIKANETRYRSIFEQSFDGIFVVKNFHIVAANPAISRVLGYHPDSLVGKPLAEFLVSDSKKVFEHHHMERINGVMTPKNYVVKATKSDGLVVELMASSTGMKWEDVNASLITLKDLTEIKLLEEARNINRSFTNNDIDFHLKFDADCRILQANSAYLRYHNINADEIVGTSAFGFAPEEYHDGYFEALQSLTFKNPTGRLQSTIVMRNGEERVQDWIVHAIFNDAGFFKEYHAIGRDITEIVNALSSCEIPKQ